MTDAPEPPASRSNKRSLLVGLLLAVIGGGLGYFAVFSGYIGADRSDDQVAAATETGTDQLMQAFAFVPLDPLIISLPGATGRDHLRFAAQLEVDPAKAATVEALKPRIVDVLNGYLRAVELAELEDPAALIRLRAQMLRRIQVVTGPDVVRDLLIMEFVLS